jgi:hypothetical protein
MDNSNHIDVNKLTQEAEAGHGHFVRAVLDEMSFQDRLKVLRQVQNLSEEHHRRDAENPYLVLKAGVNGDFHCAYMDLERHVPHKGFLGLLDRSHVLYEDFIHFPGGEESFADSDDLFD